MLFLQFDIATLPSYVSAARRPWGIFKEGCVASVTCHGAGCWVGASWMAFIIRGSSVLRKPAFNPLSGIAACCEEEEGPVSFSNIGGDG